MNATTVTVTTSNDAPNAVETHAQEGVRSAETQSAVDANSAQTNKSPDQKTSSNPLRLIKSMAQQASAAAGSAVSSATGAVVGATIQTGQTAFEITQGAFSAVIGTAAKATTDSFSALTNTIGQSTAVASDFVGQQFADVITNAGKVVTGAGGTLSTTVDALAGDPNTPQPIHMQGLRIALGLLPVVGNAKAIGDARQKYKQAMALSEGDERNKLMHEARRDCLIASALLSMEVATLGASGALDKALKGGNVIGSALNAGKTVREVSQSRWWLPKVDLDILSPRVDLALEFPPLREAMDIILRFDPNAAAPK